MPIGRAAGLPPSSRHGAEKQNTSAAMGAESEKWLGMVVLIWPLCLWWAFSGGRRTLDGNPTAAAAATSCCCKAVVLIKTWPGAVSHAEPCKLGCSRVGHRLPWSRGGGCGSCGGLQPSRWFPPTFMWDPGTGPAEAFHGGILSPVKNNRQQRKR